VTSSTCVHQEVQVRFLFAAWILIGTTRVELTFIFTLVGHECFHQFIFIGFESAIIDDYFRNLRQVEIAWAIFITHIPVVVEVVLIEYWIMYIQFIVLMIWVYQTSLANWGIVTSELRVFDVNVGIFTFPIVNRVNIVDKDQGSRLKSPIFGSHYSGHIEGHMGTLIVHEATVIAGVVCEGCVCERKTWFIHLEYPSFNSVILLIDTESILYFWK
jgi:hypothetical protein